MLYGFLNFLFHRQDVAVFVVGEGSYLQAAEPGGVMGGHTVVMEEVPLALVLRDAVVGGPAHYRFQNDALVGEGAVGVVAHGIAQIVAVTRGVAEIVLALVLVHPAGLEEAVWVIGGQHIAVLVYDDHGTGHFGKLLYVVGHQGYA